MILLLMSTDEPFNSPVSLNMILIAGIHFEYISCW